MNLVSIFSMLPVVLTRSVLVPLVGLCSLISLILTCYLVSDVVNAPSPLGFRLLEWALLADLMLFLFLTILIANRVLQYGNVRKSILRSKIVLMFSMVSSVPTVAISVFSTVFLNYGVRAWFDERIETALAESVKVANAYLNEHVRNIAADSLAMSYDISSSLTEGMMNTPGIIDRVIQAQADLRGLIEAVLFYRGSIITKSSSSTNLDLDITDSDYEKADSGQVVMMAKREQGKVLALVKLKRVKSTYLLIGKLIDSRVLSHMETTRGADYAYRDLKHNISIVQLQFLAAFILVSLLLLLAAIWAGIILSDYLVTPLSGLVDAANQVKTGNFEVAVLLNKGKDEISDLQNAFNKMTLKLKDQHFQLRRVNDELNVRRIFVETVVSNLDSGVIVLDENLGIKLFNRYAMDCLKLYNIEEGGEVVDVFPELINIIESVHTEEGTFTGHELLLLRDNIAIILFIRVVIFGDGYIVTFNDITKLVNAQKAATWADIARKIAHEIKNPITPICLAAFRLKKLCKTQEKNELMEKYIDTIERNSSNLSRIVDEFADFARMPDSIMSRFEVSRLFNAVVFSRQVESTEVDYVLSLPEEKIYIVGDEGQMELVLYNILKNSFQAISESKYNRHRGKVLIDLSLHAEDLVIQITDNGPGFAEELLDKLLDPYITTRKTGNGLGLAISKKIICEHNGSISLFNIHDDKAEIIGAKVLIHLPLNLNQYYTRRSESQLDSR